jgi:hypothetical protein
MDFPDEQKPMTATPWRSAAWVAAVVALLVYLEILALNVGAVAGGSDSSGYLNHAKLIAVGTVHAPVRTLPGLPQQQAIPYLYIPLGFRPSLDNDGMIPTYPVGLSLFIVAAKFFFGWRHAGDIIMLLHAAAGIVVTYALARLLGLSKAWSVLCAAVVALSPLYIFMSQQAMSDVPSLAWTTFAVYAALRSRERSPWALLAGAALAIDVLLRPANVLAFLPVILALGWSPKRWALLAAAGLPGAAVFFTHNEAAYGSYFITGYGDPSNVFHLSLIRGTVLHYLLWLPMLFTPLVILVVGIPFLPSGKFRSGLILSAWLVSFAAFYAVYQFTHETWWYLRFLLPAVPALVIGSALVLRTVLLRSKGGQEWAASPLGFVLSLGFVVAASVGLTMALGAMRGGDAELRYGELTEWMKVNLPADAACLTMQASGSVYYNTRFTILRWDMMDRATTAQVKKVVTTAKVPLFAVLFPFEVPRIQDLEKQLQGKWEVVGRVEDITIFQRRKPAAGN